MKFSSSLFSMLVFSTSLAHAPGMSAVNFYFNEEHFIIRVYGHLSSFGENYEAGVKERFKLELDGQEVRLEPTQIFVNTMLDWVTWETELAVAPQSIRVNQELFPELSNAYTIVSVLKNDELTEQVNLNEVTDSYYFAQEAQAKGFAHWLNQLFKRKD